MSAPSLTASQTVGPFFAIGLTRGDRPAALGHRLIGPGTTGQRMRIQGHVYDGDHAPVPDAMLELWQANAAGRYRHPADNQQELPLDSGFTGFGRTGTDEEGRYWFETVKPGRVPGPDGPAQAPHIVVTVFARGMLNHAVTRLYFADEPSNAEDAVLKRVTAERRALLLAQPHDQGNERAYQFDIVLQGEGETPFFNV
ncbi:MAG: protocatechuate 3,4-dioxygenase subunit alpha [Chloroflexota bacterium]|nr:protocatechuate 3,4-dioxygenase subunit alpha [Chloroflexota bacterium]